MSAQTHDYDLIIRNGYVVDGSGLPRRRVDVGIRDGKVAKMAHLEDKTAAQEIDAEGMIVAPGIVDAHTHYDPQITFAATLPSEGEFDIVYAWSAIHYVPDPLDLLVGFTRYRPQIILIVHSPFAPRAFVRAQVQGTVCLPHWVISLPEAERVMQEHGYRLAMRATDDFAYNVDNYDADHRVPHMANLLFVRD